MASSAVKISDTIAPHFYPLYKDFMEEGHSHYWLEGGRGSTKSSVIAVCIVMGIVTHPEANAICARQFGTELHFSVYSQIVWAINLLGLTDRFKIPKGDAGGRPITYLQTGQQIYFTGLDDPEMIKSFKCVTGYLKYSWFEEVHQFKNMGKIRNANQSIRRGSDQKFITFYSYNPPRNKGNWINEQSEQMRLREDVFYSHSSWEDLPLHTAKRWLGPDWIKDALILKDSDHEAYVHEYLGIPTGYGTGIFKNIVTRIIHDDEIEYFDNVAGGIDWGFATDPATYTRSHYDKKRRTLYIFEEIYGSGISNRNLIEMIKRTYENELIVADSAEPKSIKEMVDGGLRCIPAKKGSGSIEYGIKFLQDLEEIVIDPVRCPNSKREFLNAEYETDKFGNVMAKVSKNNHILDNIRYRMELESRVKWGWDN